MKRHLMLAAVFLIVICGASTVVAEDFKATSVPLIPYPYGFGFTEGSFTIPSEVRIDMDTKEAKRSAECLAATLAEALNAKATITRGKPDGATVHFRQQGIRVEEMGQEGYELVVDANGIRVHAAKPAGMFYAVQTLRQLIWNPDLSPKNALPCLTIIDRPRFGWRGLMLDCSRTFLPMEYLRKYVDLLALYKMNVLHLHLTDDQGWRMPVPKYPKLTTVGARFADCYTNERNGFYTKKELRDLIKYAAARNVTIVPEIEMPGHCTAALAAYPELSCSGGPFEIRPFFDTTGINVDVFCPGNEATFTFLENVLKETIAVFPSEYIHIGGDEVPKTRWKECPKCQARMKAEGLKTEDELQSYFVKRIERFLVSKHRHLLGWDEIMEGGLAPQATVMSWRGVEPGMKAIEAGHEVVFAPTTYCYLDYSSNNPMLRKTYSYDPLPSELTQSAAKVLGIQGCMWTHIARTDESIDRQIFPRLAALAEVAWTPPFMRDYDLFLQRMDVHKDRWGSLGTHYAENALIPGVEIGTWIPAQVSESYKTLDWDVTPQIKKPGRASATFQYTNGTCRLGIEWVALQLVNGKEVARDTHRGMTGAVDQDNVYTFDIKEVPPGAGYILRASVRSEGGPDSNGYVLFSSSR